mgnify:CR=1 FL=1
MELRLTGTKEEVAQFVALLKAVTDLQLSGELSEALRNRCRIVRRVDYDRTGGMVQAYLVLLPPTPLPQEEA